MGGLRGGGHQAWNAAPMQRWTHLWHAYRLKQLEVFTYPSRRVLSIAYSCPVLMHMRVRTHRPCTRARRFSRRCFSATRKACGRAAVWPCGHERHAISCHAILCHATPRHAMQRHAPPRHTMPFHTMPRFRENEKCGYAAADILNSRNPPQRWAKHVHIDMRINMCIDRCIDTFIDTCIDVCI